MSREAFLILNVKPKNCHPVKTYLRKKNQMWKSIIGVTFVKNFFPLRMNCPNTKLSMDYHN